MKRSLLAGMILVAVWATVFFVPSLNFLFRSQWQGNVLMSFTVRPAPWRDQIPDGELQRFERDKNVLLLAALQYPRAKKKVDSNGDWQPQDREEFYPSVLFPGNPEGTRHGEWLRRLEQLVAKYPDDATLIAATLRMGLLAGPRGRVAEALSAESGPPSTTKPLNPAVLQRLLVLCERGRKLEPDNLFFDWMRCCFLLLSWRDKDALQVLEEAAARPRYDAHVLQGLQYFVQAHSVLLGRPLTLEEKAELVASSDLADTSSYWNLARMVGVHITKAERRGDHREALRLTELLVVTGTKMRQTRQFSTAPYSILEEVGYEASIYDAMAAKSPVGMTIEETKLALFRPYAQRHGRHDLAAAAQAYYQQKATGQKQINTLSETEFLGVSYWNWVATALLWQVGVLLLLYLAVPLLLCLVLGVVLCRRSEYDSEPLHAHKVWQWTWVCSVGLILLQYVLTLGLVVSYGGHEGSSLDYWFFENFYLFGRNKHDLTDVLWLPVIFATLLAAHHAVRWQIRDEPLKVSWFARVVQFAVVMTLGIISWNVIFSEEHVALWFLLALSSAVLFYYLRQWRKRPHRRAAVRYGLRFLYHSLATWLVVGSILYLGTLIIALPLRNRVEAKVDRVLAVGQER